MEKQPDIRNMLNDLCASYSNKELGQKFNVSPKTIARWRSGESAPHSLMVMAIRHLFRTSSMTRTDGEFTFIDLFAGIGGIRLGFEHHGGECVFTSEWDKYCQKTYLENFGSYHSIIGDIVPFDPGKVPDHDVLLAGFPCQPFSLAGVSKKKSLGRPHGFEDRTQGTLFFNVAQIIDKKRPAAFLLENVKNLKSHDKGNTFRVIQDVLVNELGYNVQWRVIDAKHFVPQHRERIFIAGFRDKTDFDFDRLLLPEPEKVMRDILHPEDGSEYDTDNGRFIDERGKVLEKYILTPRLWEYLKAYADKHRAKGNGFGFGMVKPEDTARTLSARYYKDGSEILVYRGNRKRPRRLTPRECARLMGYPDTFKIPASDMQSYKQFGNSVVVPVISVIAEHMKEHVMKIKNKKKVSRQIKQAEEVA